MMSQKPNEESPTPFWPAYLEQGFEMIYGEYIPPDEVEAFSERWGGLKLDNFVEALNRGEGRDRLLALSVLGYSGDTRMISVLHPLLRSSDPKERWLSTIGLGRLKDETVYPALVSLLTEFFPSEQHPGFVQDQAWFDEWRWTVIEVLSLWNNPSLVSAFREAYQRSVEAELSVPPFGRHIVLQRWYGFQEMLCRALGKRGAFGAFTGLRLPPAHLKIGIVNMALGYCHVEEKYRRGEPLYEWKHDEEMVQALLEVLEQRFGLTEEERVEYLELGKASFVKQRQQLEEDWRKL